MSCICICCRRSVYLRIGKYGKIIHYDSISIGVGNIKRFTIIEIKCLGGIIVNIFNTKDQDRFHSHAFNSFSWMIRGWYKEDVVNINNNIKTLETKIISKSRFIPRYYIHKIKESSENAISITFEGSWKSHWKEYFDNEREKTYTWGRKVIFDSKYPYING